MSVAVISIGVTALCGCSADVGDFSEKLQPVKVTSTPANAIERGLAYCGARTESAEIACLRKGLKESAISLSGLASMIPGCRVGKQCKYDYTTEDQVGLFKPTASDFIVRWDVSFDLRHSGGTIDDIPISVVQISA